MDEKSIDTKEYWKEKYEYLNLQYDEFQQHSRELESELEQLLKHEEDKVKELQIRNNRLNIDNETLKNKLNEINSSTHKQISQLQEELAKFKAVKDEMQKYIRELEQKNDNLEQTNRCAMFSLSEFESKLNEAIERNAILEIELDEKDELAETVQRLRDEARDLKQELAARHQKAQKEINQSLNANQSVESINNIQSNNQTFNMEIDQVSLIQSPPTSPANMAPINTILNDLNLQQQQLISQKKSSQLNLACNSNGTNNLNYNHSVVNNNHNNNSSNQQQLQPVTPSLRISALNFVGDALRKVTSIESRLVSNRNLMKESNRDRRSATISTIEASSFNNVVPLNQGNSNSVNNASSVCNKNTTTNNITTYVY